MTPGASCDRATVELEVRREAISSPVAAEMIAALNAELASRYPEQGATHFRLELDEVAQGRGAFLVAYAGDKPLGCGAVRRLDAATAEIKRMYVDPGTRGRGVGGAPLGALEAEARRLQVERIALETGERQHEAARLCERRDTGASRPLASTSIHR